MTAIRSWFKSIEGQTPKDLSGLWCALLLLAVASPAIGQTSVVSTVSSWDGSSAAYSFGYPNGVAADTYGQTFTVPAEFTVLSDINFRVGYNFGDALTFTGYLMAWDGTEATGSVLFQSGSETVNPSTVGLATIDFSVPHVALTAGKSYVFFLLASEGTGGAAAARFGVTGNSSAYAGGNFVFTDSKGSFANLSTPWLQTGTTSGFGDAVFEATFNQAQPEPVLMAPTQGATLPSGSNTFTWTSPPSITHFVLDVGTAPGRSDIYKGGEVASPIFNVTMPSNGVEVYAELLYELNNSWLAEEYTFSESGTPMPPVMVSPAPATILPSANPVGFAWTSNGASTFVLEIGSEYLGSDIYKGSPTAAHSASVSVPQNGAPIYVSLEYLLDGVWNRLNTTYTEYGLSTPPLLTLPPTVVSSAGTFTWTAGAGPSAYELLVGTKGQGTSNIYKSGVLTATSVLVSNMPAPGTRVYVELLYRIGATWKSSTYTYIEPPPAPRL